MKLLVYIKDTLGEFWTVAFLRDSTRTLADYFEYASYQTFGGNVIGCKETTESDLEHRSVSYGLID